MLSCCKQFHARGEKQRLIWAYKILFLDVLQLSGHIFCEEIGACRPFLSFLLFKAEQATPK